MSKAGQAEGQVEDDEIKIIKKLTKLRVIFFSLCLDYILVRNCPERC